MPSRLGRIQRAYLNTEEGTPPTQLAQSNKEDSPSPNLAKPSREEGSCPIQLVGPKSESYLSNSDKPN